MTQNPYLVLLHHPVAFVSYIFLLLTVVNLWIPASKYIGFKLWGVFVIIAIALALLAKVIHPIALVPIFTLAIACYYTEQAHENKYNRVAAAAVFTLLALGFSGHIIPGFNNLRLLDKIHLSVDSSPFTLYLNFDKALVGIFLLGFTHPLLATWKQWRAMSITTWPWTLLIMAVLAIAALATGYVNIDPKFPSSFFIWAIANLFFVCAAEEAFFRGFIQKHLSHWLHDVKGGYVIAILIATLLFGLVHFKGGVVNMSLAAIAGIGYGWIYHRTKSIEASILAHFLLNVGHFLLFSYPAI